jgi:filamentous hemagglutinin
VIDGGLQGSGLSQTTQKAIIAGGSIAGSALIANASGKDMMTSANAAANEVTNNYLDHREAQAKEKAEKRLAECTDDTCRQSAKQEIDGYNKLSAERDDNLRTACADNPSGPNCQLQIGLAKEAAASYRGKGVQRYSSVGDEMAKANRMAGDTPHYQPDGMRLLAARIGMPLAIVGGVTAAVTAGEIASYCLGNPVACNAVGVDVGALLAGSSLPNGVNNGAVALEKAVANQVEKAAARELVTSEGKANAVTGARLADDLAAAQAKDPRIGTTLAGANAPVTVTAESNIGGRTLVDTNQTARPVTAADPNKPTLIADLVPPGNPNSNMANAHAEIGVIQQAYDAGLTHGQNMTIVVRGEAVCTFCRDSSSLVAAADRAGLTRLEVVDTKSQIKYVWTKGAAGLVREGF